MDIESQAIPHPVRPAGPRRRRAVKKRAEEKKLRSEALVNARNCVMAAALLILAGTLALHMNPPGGVDDWGHSRSASTVSYALFYVFNSVCFLSSLWTVVLSLRFISFKEKSLKKFIATTKKLMLVSCLSLLCVFLTGGWSLQKRHSQRRALLVFCMIFFLLFLGIAFREEKMWKESDEAEEEEEEDDAEEEELVVEEEEAEGEPEAAAEAEEGGGAHTI